MENDKISIRVIFMKDGMARFISHLDLNRCMQRAIKRSGIPIWYTMGFNPHQYLMFPLPLTLGLISEYEVMDIGITEEIPMDELKDRLNAVLPEGIRIVSAAPPVHKHTDIAFAEYEVRLVSEGSASVKEDFIRFLSEEKIEVEKFSKRRGSVSVDIKPDIELISIYGDGDTAEITLRLPAGNEKNINASLVFEAFESYCGDKATDLTIKRTKILCRDGEIFS